MTRACMSSVSARCVWRRGRRGSRWKRRLDERVAGWSIVGRSWRVCRIGGLRYYCHLVRTKIAVLGTQGICYVARYLNGSATIRYSILVFISLTQDTQDTQDIQPTWGPYSRVTNML